MGRKICFLSLKKSGKTASSINTAAALGSLGLKVLLLDLDSQGTATLWLDEAENSNGVHRLLIDNEKPKDVIVETSFQNVFLIGGGESSAAAKNTMQMVSGANLILKNKLANLKGYDYIIFDCPSGLDFMVMTALLAAKEIIVPVEYQFLALRGVGQMLQLIAQLKERVVPDIKLSGILLTQKYTVQTDGEFVSEGTDRISRDFLFNTVIPVSEDLNQSIEQRMPSMYFSPACLAAKAYHQFAKELIGQLV